MKSNSWMGKNKKALMVVRVSGSGQEHNNSHIYQTDDGKEYARENGLDLVEVIPIVESAKRSELRFEFHKAIAKALKNNIRHILFYKVDRESRNLTDTENNEKLVMEDKIVIHYVADRKVLHKYSPESEFMIRDFQAAQNKHYVRELRNKIRRATISKAESGWSPNAKPPDGYINQKVKTEQGFDRRRGSIIVPDLNSIRLKRVIREFEIRAEPITPPLQEIRKRIISEGLVTLDHVKKYHISSIERRLKNKFYDGRFDWYGQEYKGLHERIIPKELYWKVQETFGHKNPYGKKTSGLFRNGWLKCAQIDCGCHIIYDPRIKQIVSTGETKTYHHYRCTNGKRAHSNTKGLRISEDQILKQFEASMDAISISDAFKDELLTAINATQVRAKAVAKLEFENYEALLKSLENKEDKLYEDFCSQILNQESYSRLMAKVRAERDLCTQKMKEAQFKITDVKNETVNSILQLATNAKSLWKSRSPQEQVMFLEKLLSNQALDGTSVRFELIKPLRILEEMKENINWRRGRITN